MTEKALVVLSGGQDSTTCLFWAIKEYGVENVHAITFNYGQRHVREIEAATKIAQLAGVADRHEVCTLGDILRSTSPLVSGSELEQYADHQSLPGGLEATFVPMRNTLFLTIAANRAYELRAFNIVTGVCEEDFGGYPDCRQVFIEALEDAFNHSINEHDGPLSGMQYSWRGILEMNAGMHWLIAILLTMGPIHLLATITQLCFVRRDLKKLDSRIR